MTTRKFQKKFFLKKSKNINQKSKKISKNGYPKYAHIRDGGLPPILFTFWKFTPKKTPFLLFFRFWTFLYPFSESRARCSWYVQNFILFRTNPILYNNLYILWICARVPCFSIFALYRYARVYAYMFRFCLYFVHFRKYDTKNVICVLLEKKSLEKSCNKEKCCIFAL